MPSRRSRSLRAGMTLMEIMVVLIIMSLIASLVGIAVFDNLHKAKLQAAKLDAKALVNALELYRAENSSYPDNLAQLVPGQLSELREDSWGNPWQYERSEDGYRLVSSGPDGKAGGGDDIVRERRTRLAR